MHAPAEENELDRAGIAFKNHIARLKKYDYHYFLLLNVSFFIFWLSYFVFFFVLFIFFLYEFTIDYC